MDNRKLTEHPEWLNTFLEAIRAYIDKYGLSTNAFGLLLGDDPKHGAGSVSVQISFLLRNKRHGLNADRLIRIARLINFDLNRLK